MPYPRQVRGWKTRCQPLPAAQQVEFWIAVPENATGEMYSRFRFTAQTGQGGNAAAGPAYSGEVEDYALAEMGDQAWLDVNRDGVQDEARDQEINGVIVKLLDGNGDPVVDANGSPLTSITAGHPLTGAQAGTSSRVCRRATTACNL